MTQIQLRRDTASNWSTNNPIPAQGEPCYETDTNKLKFGDGTSHYNDLDYFAGDITPYVLPIASTTVLGGIKVGEGLSITEDGVLSSTGGGTPTDVYTKQEVDTKLQGKQNTLIAGQGININEDGTISANTNLDVSNPLELAYPQLPNHGISLNDDGTFRRIAGVVNQGSIPSIGSGFRIINFSSSNLSGQTSNTIPINNYDAAYANWEAGATIVHEMLLVDEGGSNPRESFVFGNLEDSTFTMKACIGLNEGGSVGIQINSLTFTGGSWSSKVFTPSGTKYCGSGTVSYGVRGDDDYCKFGLNEGGNYALTFYDKATNTLKAHVEFTKGDFKTVVQSCNCVLLPFGYVDYESNASLHYDPEYNKVLSSTGAELWTATIPNTSETPTLQLNYDNTLLVNENNQLSVNSGGLGIPTATSELSNDSGFITKDVNNLTNYTPTSSLATVATTGSYNDLSDKPTIPTEYVLPPATTTTLGGVKPDGTTITVTDDGVISSVGGGGGEPTDTYTKEEIDNKLEQKQNAFDCALPLDLLEAETYGGDCFVKSSGEDEYYYMPSLGLPIQYAGPVVTKEALPMQVQYVPLATSADASAFTPVEYNGAFSDWQSDYHIYYEALKPTNDGDYPNYFFGFCNYFSASKDYAPRGCIYGKTTDSNYTFTMMVDLFGGGLDLGGGNIGFNFRQGTVLATTTIPLTYLDSSLYYLDFHFEGNDFKIDVLKKEDDSITHTASFGLDVAPSFNTASAVIMPLVRNVSSKRIYNANYFKVTDGEGNVVWSPAKQPTYGNQLVLKYNDTLILSGEELSVNTGNLATKSGNNIFTGENTFNQSVTFGNTTVTPEGRTIFDASLGSGLIAIGDTNASLSLRSSGNIQVNSDVMVTSGNVGTYAATTTQGANADTAIANLNGMKFWSGTQTEYDGLEAKDNTTLYIITGE